MESGSRQTLRGVGGVHLLDNEDVFLLLDVLHRQVAQDDLLHRPGGVGAGPSAGEGVFIHSALAPNALAAQIQDILRPVPEGGFPLLLVDAGVVSSFQGIVDCHQLLGAGHNGIAEEALLVAPDTRLNPGVHVPAVARVPDVVDAQGNGLIGENAGGVGIVVGHHGFHGGVRDGPLVPPGLALERVPHVAALGAAEAGGGLVSVFEGHFMERAAPQGRGLIGHAGVAELLQRDGIPGGKGRGGEQAQDADQRQQQGRQARSQGMMFFVHKGFLSILNLATKKGPLASCQWASVWYEAVPEWFIRRDYGWWDHPRPCSSRPGHFGR